MSKITLVEAAYQEKEYDLLLGELKENSLWQSSLYSSSMLSYYLQQCEDKKWTSKNISFVLKMDDNPFFAYIGYLQIKDEIEKISAYELPSIFLEASDLPRICKKSIQANIHRLIFRNSCQFSFLDYMHHGRLTCAMDYIIQNRVCKINLQYTRIIDLKQGKNKIKGGFRKRYSSLINWGLREMKIELYTQQNISWSAINDFKVLHTQESGRQTRSDLTWLSQYKAILNDEAFCIQARYNNDLVSAGFFTLSSGHCYYASSASRRALFDKPLFHALMWQAIVYAMSRGATVFETGTDYPLHIQKSETVSSKELQIAKFKSGFGGILKPVMHIFLDKN